MLTVLYFVIIHIWVPEFFPPYVVFVAVAMTFHWCATNNTHLFGLMDFIMTTPTYKHKIAGRVVPKIAILVVDIYIFCRATNLTHFLFFANQIDKFSCRTVSRSPMLLIFSCTNKCFSHTFLVAILASLETTKVFPFLCVPSSLQFLPTIFAVFLRSWFRDFTIVSHS